jgi:hypothetical protein
MVRAAVIGLGWLAAACAVACAPDPPRREIPPVVWAGEHLEYAPQEGAYEPCAGTLPYMDRYVERAAEAMGVELEQPIVYVHGSDVAESFCEHEGTLGCSFADSIYARVAPQEHELVHGVRAAHGFSHLFFEEGTAEVFGDDAAMPFRVAAEGELLEAMNSATFEDGLPTRWYPRAGHFAAFLHDRYGSEVTAALLLETEPRSTPERALAVIEATTGVPFAEIRQAYALEPTCGQAQYRYPLIACEEPAALRARCDREVSVVETIACDDLTTLGPRDGELWKYLGLEVENDGEYLITAYDEAEESFQPLVVKECAIDCEAILHEQRVGLDRWGVPVFLRAGRYSVKVIRYEGDPGEVSVAVKGRECG